jgi:hypothetical protein
MDNKQKEEDNQRYLKNEINPILEPMMLELVKQKPSN